MQADLDLIPPAPNIGGTGSVGPDCHEPRIDSGPPGADAIFTAYRTGTRVIATRYLGSVADIGGVLAAAGRAPKVRFDGTRFWVAWIDETGGDHLRIATLDESLATTAVDLPGWTVAVDEAFALVRVGNVVYLVLLSSDAMTVMRTCFP